MDQWTVSEKKWDLGIAIAALVPVIVAILKAMFDVKSAKAQHDINNPAPRPVTIPFSRRTRQP